MNDSMHVHRLSPSWWFGNVFLGAFLLLIVIGAVILNTPEMFSDTIGFLGFLILIALILPLSLALLARPFLTKMIVKPDGIEYHSTFFVLQADWKNLVNLGYAQNTNTGRTLVVVPREGTLHHRKWARPFRNLLREYPNHLQEVEILVSRFNERNGHSFETDVLVNVAQQSEFSEKLEALNS